MTFQISITDATTGQTIVRDMTPDEIAARQMEIEAAIAAKQAAADETTSAAAKRETVLAALAAAAGLEVDEVKAALGA